MRSPPDVLPPRPVSAISWLPLLLLTLVSFALWFVTTFVVLLPLLVPGMGIREDAGREPSTGLTGAIGIFMLLIFQLFFALFIVSIVRAVLIAPGDIPSWLRSDGKSDLHSYSNLLQAVERKRDGSPRFCRKTGAYKPDRAHYCAEVGRCVLQFQHFSVPLNSAIGFYNYKFYLLSLFYGVLCAAWVVASTLPEVVAPRALLSAVPAPRHGPSLRVDGVSTAAVLGQLQAMGESMMYRDAPNQWVVRALKGRLLRLVSAPTCMSACCTMRRWTLLSSARSCSQAWPSWRARRRCPSTHGSSRGGGRITSGSLCGEDDGQAARSLTTARSTTLPLRSVCTRSCGCCPHAQDSRETASSTPRGPGSSA